MYLLAFFLSSLCVSVVFVWYMHVGGHTEGGGHLLSCLSLFSAIPWHWSLTEPGVRLYPLNPSDPPASAFLYAPTPNLHTPAPTALGLDLDFYVTVGI